MSDVGRWGAFPVTHTLGTGSERSQACAHISQAEIQ